MATPSIPSIHQGESRIIRVQSRSRPNLMHYTDGERGYCSCEHHQYTGEECRHLRLVNAQPYTITRVEIHDGYRRTSRYDIHDSIDHQAIAAMRRVIDDFITAAGIRDIKLAYLAAEHGDACHVAWDLQIHPYVAIAVLDNLSDSGELPPHPSMY